MEYRSFLDTLPRFLFDEPTTLKAESTEIVEWKKVLERIIGELKKEPQFMEKLESFPEKSLSDKKVAFLCCLFSNVTIKKMIGEYVAKCKKQIEIGTTGKKDATKAASIRLQGNSLFVKKEYHSAFKLYTRGLMFVRDEDEETPLLYANRSATYFYLKQHENALEDIERAFKCGYDKFKPAGKLLIRKGFSLLALGRDDQAKELLDASMPANENEPDFAQWQQLKKQSENVNRQITKRHITMSQFQDVSTISTALSTDGVFHPHERYPWLNAKVDLRYDTEKGYSLISKEELKYGEIVALSKPFVNLDPKRDSYERCHHCMVPCFELPKYFTDKPKHSSDSLRMVTPFACSECCNVLYCSEACRTAAWTAYHRFECSQIPVLTQTVDSKAHLALRMFYMIGRLEESSPNEFSGCKTVADLCAFLIDQQAYSSVYLNQRTEISSLVMNIERTLTVGFLFKLVQMSDLLGEPKSLNNREYIDQASKGLMTLLFHLYQVEVNESVPFTCPITDQTVTPGPCFSVDGMTALMKHSCEATVADSPILRESLESNVKLLYATGPIPVGTVLTLAYEIKDSDTYELLYNRKIQLALRYRINCTCTRCVREDRDCDSTDIYYPIACSLCGSLMVRAAGEEEGNSSSLLDDSYRCSSTDGCNFKYTAQQMKNVYERLGKMREEEKSDIYCAQDTYRTLKPKVKQLKTAIESTAPLLYGRSIFLAQVYGTLAQYYLLITLAPISSRYSAPIGTGVTSANHRVHRGHLTTTLLYANKAFDILESMQQGAGVKTLLAELLFHVFDCLHEMIECIILQQQRLELLPPIEQLRRRYEALLKMTAYDTMVVSSLAAKE